VRVSGNDAQEVESVSRSLVASLLAAGASPSDLEKHVQATESAAKKVFVVHGHEEGARETVARFLEKIELEPIILVEQLNKGRTIIEKFEDHAGAAKFAIVLLTPDDVGGLKSADLAPRARQNVVFELGYFVGRLGRGNVCLLKKGDVEGFSDFHGVVYVDLDVGGAWKVRLARELEGGGLRIDMAKAARA
jgi:predicted nucleotide-binding protein